MSLRAWRIRARSCWASVPGWVSIQPPSASSSAIRRSRQRSASCSAAVSCGGAAVLLVERRADRVERGGVEAAHQLADELHLAALALEVGDALGIVDRVLQLVAEVELVEQAGAQREQGFAERLEFGAFAFEVGLACRVGAFELALELKVEFAAFGDELATDEVAFFGFAGHRGNRWPHHREQGAQVS